MDVGLFAQYVMNGLMRVPLSGNSKERKGRYFGN